MKFLSEMPRQAKSALSKAIGSSLALMLVACHLPPPGTASKQPIKQQGTQSAPVTGGAVIGASGVSRLEASGSSSPAPGLSYNSMVYSRGPFRPTINPRTKSPDSYTLMDTADPCPPIPLFDKGTDNYDIAFQGTTCHVSESYYYYWKITPQPDGTLLYEMYYHSDQHTVCDDHVVGKGAEGDTTYDGPQINHYHFYCGSPATPTPPADTPTPPVESPNPPSAPPASSPPSVPPPPSQPPSDPPSPTPTPKPPFDLKVDNAAISPNGDGKEDSTIAHIKAGVPWKLEVKGAGLTAPALVMEGSGNADPTWTGLAGGQALRNGTYEMTLTDTSQGETRGQTRSVTVVINAWTLNRDLDAFSPVLPSGPGVKNRVHLSGQGNGAWTISVDGHPGTVFSGSNTQSYDWNGKVNGNILKDGKYTLRLTPQGLKANSSDPTVDITIDRTGPVITQAEVSGIDNQIDPSGATDIDGNPKIISIYTLSVSAKDANGNNNDPNIDKSSLNIDFQDAAFTRTGDEVMVSGDNYTVKYKYLDAPITTTKLKYKVTIKDSLGNTSKEFSNQFQLRTEDLLAGGFEEDSGSAFRILENINAETQSRNLLAVGRTVYSLMDQTFYIKSEIPLVLHGEITLTIPNNPKANFPVNVIFYIKRKDRVGPPAWVQLIHARANATTQYVVRWDGNYFGMLSAAKTGRYQTDVPAVSPWVDFVQPRGIEFKLSDRPVITRSNWRNLAPVALSLRQQSHIMDRHILSPINRHRYVHIDYIKKRIDSITNNNPSELFSTYDSYFNVARPTCPSYMSLPVSFSWTPKKTYPNYNLPPYDYDEFLEVISPTPWGNTAALANGAARTSLETLTKMASAVMNAPSSDKWAYANGFYMPVVLPNGRVLFVGEFPFPSGFVSIFPHYSGQRSYERGI